MIKFGVIELKIQFNLKRIIMTLENVSLRQSVKRCLDSNASKRDEKRHCLGYALHNTNDQDSINNFGIDKKTHNLVLGAHFLNACQSGNVGDAQSAFSNIMNFSTNLTDSLTIKNAYGRTAFSYVQSNEAMGDLTAKIENVFISMYLKAVKECNKIFMEDLLKFGNGPLVRKILKRTTYFE